ncbi:MAG: transglutaminaseTgpA domain-containing protein [Bifidobacterium aquikefiri]|uniref:Transglutaminase-like superfamily n=1 Tax=Bifidobacterium aquikefiri TaxID=1653207 RepID=A0A261G8A8_9BIFI|nr:transglutaminaseTgpA domain-containing protein [Bifidobacterium aquikefiri]OZG67669.1 Transglutaminase-like superfamily [Bifidobacterium aquikefiri]
MMHTLRSAFRSWRSARLHRWRSRGTIRPTAGGVLVMVVAAIVTFFGLMLDDKSLMASCVAVWLLVLVSLLLVGLQRVCLQSSYLYDREHASSAVQDVFQWQPYRQLQTDAQDIPVKDSGVPDDSDVSTLVRLSVPHLMRGFLLPRVVTTTLQWVSLDASGSVVASLVGRIAPVRGLYRLHSVVVMWSDPFGIWRIRSIHRDIHDEYVVLPDVEEQSSQRMRTLSNFVPGNAHTQSFSGVRAYAQGDSPRMIAWKYTAHRGELMTRESNREIPAKVLLILDEHDRHLESCIAQALMYCSHSVPSEASISVSDGHVIAESGSDVYRFLASLQYRDQQSPHMAHSGAEQVSDGSSPAVKGSRREGLVQAPVDVHGHEGSEAEKSAIFKGLNHKIREYNRIVVLTSSTQTHGIEKSLQHSAFSDRYELRHVQPDACIETKPQLKILKSEATEDAKNVEHARKATVQATKPGLPRALGTLRPVVATVMAAKQSENAATQSKATSASIAWQHNASLLNAMAAQLMSILALLALFGTTLQSITAVIEPQGIWIWYLAAGFAVLSIEISIPARNLVRSLIRTGGDCVLFLTSGVVLADTRIYQTRGIWLFQQAQTTVETAANGIQHTVTTPSGFSTAWDALTDGFNSMYEQYPPVSIDADADALILVVGALTLMLLRCLMTQIQTSPMLALFPIITMSFSYLVVGSSVQWWMLFGVIMAALTLLWTTNRSPGFVFWQRSGPSGSQSKNWQIGSGSAVWVPIPTIICAIITAIAMVTTPLSLSLAQRVSIGYGETPGLFSSETVSPLIDLKRNLQGGSTSTVFTYSADRAMYMRMSTLGNFNGDTWSFNLNATNNDDYGSSYQIAANSDLYSSQWANESSSLASTSADRLTQLARFASLSVFDIENLDDYLERSTIDVKALSSSFLPVPGIGIRFTGDADSSLWLTCYDGSLFTKDSGSKNDTSYGVRSVYLQPIQKTSEFDEISDVSNDMKQVLEELDEDIDEADGNANGSSDNATDAPSSNPSESSQNLSTWNLFKARLKTLHTDDTGSGRRLRQYYGSLPQALPKDAQAIVNKARSEGIPTTGANAQQEIAAMKYLVRYFTTNGFTYSLDAPDGNGRGNMQVIGDFLKTKSGYCIHYASALAVLGRAMGLSTRMVLGYNAGTTKRGTHTVTANQLHAWVETYIDGIGWVPFDVTPASESTATTDASSSAEPTASAASSTSNAIAPTASPTTSTPSVSASPSSSQNSDASQGNRAENRWNVPSYVWQIMLLLMILVIALFGPSMLRRVQRRRRLHSIETYQKVGSGFGVLVMWQEIVATAIDAGLRWTRRETDAEIAEIIAAKVARSSAATASDIRRLYAAASEVAYGADVRQGGPHNEVQPTIDTDRLRTMIAAILESRADETDIIARAARIMRRMFPQSLLRAQG